MLLIGADKNEIFQRLTVDVAYYAIALIDSLLGGSAVARHGHPAGIDNGPSLFVLMADHRGQPGQGEVFDAAHVYSRHHQIEENEDAGAYLGHAFQVFGK